MSGPTHDVPGGLQSLTDATQDWLVTPDEEGRLVARPEEEYTWRDEDQAVHLYVLVNPAGRGAKLDTLNKAGLVQVDIKPTLVRITITDVVNRITYCYQWLNLWGPIVPEKSKYHLSVDNKRLVLWLYKVYDVHAAGEWASLIDVRTGKYNKSELGWPHVLRLVQGAWRSEDEEPIEIVGHQVVWPEGSRDFLVVDEQEETIYLIQWGDGVKVDQNECTGAFERHADRIQWEDGDRWTRIPGMSLKRHEAGKDKLPLEYDNTLARWVPWLPADEIRRQLTHWLPPNSTEVALKVELESESGHTVKKELLQATSEDKDGEELLVADFDFLPIELVIKVRVCALASEELEGDRLMSTMMALRDHRRVSLASEAAALGGLERWLQWLRCWLAPGSRKNVDGAMEAIRERLFEVSKDERRFCPNPDEAERERLGLSYERWSPSWTCLPVECNDLLRGATEDLLADLREQRALAVASGGLCDPRRAFGEARRRTAEQLLDQHWVEAGERRCDPLERKWARRYGTEASRSLLGEKVGARRAGRELREGGLAIVEDALDWGTLIKVQGEVAKLLSGKTSESSNMRISAARGGHVRWVSVWESRLEELGMSALAASTCFLRQLAARMNEWKFLNCSWSAEDPVLWHDDGKPLEHGAQAALQWAAPENDLDGPLTELAEDEDGLPVPADRCVFAFLFLNTPAWLPDWGGALRCQLSQVHRDVWGDGGRLVLLRGQHTFQLQASSRSHTVLMLRLQGATVDGPRLRQPHAPAPTEAEAKREKERLLQIDQHVPRELTLLNKTKPEGYYRRLSPDEISALGEKVGVVKPEVATNNERTGDAGQGLQAVVKEGDTDAVNVTAGQAASEGVCDAEFIKDALLKEDDVDAVQATIDNACSEEVVDAEPVKEDVVIELDSHQVLKLFELALPAAFKID